MYLFARTAKDNEEHLNSFHWKKIWQDEWKSWNKSGIPLLFSSGKSGLYCL